MFIYSAVLYDPNIYSTIFTNFLMIKHKRRKGYYEAARETEVPYMQKTLIYENPARIPAQKPVTDLPSTPRKN